MTTRMKQIRRGALLLALLCLLSIFAQAAGSIDLKKAPALTLSYRSGRTPLSDAKFSLYTVADADETGELTVRPDFDAFDLDIQGRNDDKWRSMAVTLESFVLRKELKPTDSGRTDKNGTLTFPSKGKTLTAGLYLVIGERHEQDGYYYDAEPFLVMLPAQDLDKNEWVYDVTASVKYDKTPVPEEPETVTRKVLKVWDDDGYEADRPKEITVYLLRNGKVWDTVKLSAKNNWRYTWSGLDSGARWTVSEEDLDGYTTSLSREGITFVLTNTVRPNTPEKPDKPANPGKPSQPGRPTLPQTGALWWLVGMLTAAGLVFLILGALDRKRRI